MRYSKGVTRISKGMSIAIFTSYREQLDSI